MKRPRNCKVHKIQYFNTIIHGQHGIDYRFQVEKFEGIDRLGAVEVLNDETQHVMGRYSLSLFKRLVNAKAVTLDFLNYFTTEEYQELVTWLNNIK
jgi:hypothetical protein